MASTLTLWHDGSNFEFAYAIYTDSDLTILAPDGFYSANGYVREQVNGQLGTLVNCV
tara:strand:- start:3 stop:173 length:171 start_codon:yes stop_codon:yes gene_type:complete